jgi:hypothetical protein
LIITLNAAHVRRNSLLASVIAPVLGLVGGLMLPASAGAQSHWGVGASFTPVWQEFTPVRELMIDGEGSMEGTQMTIGLVRGSTRGGEWGVSFVHMPIEDDSTFVDVSDCEPAPCDPVQSIRRTRDVRLRGVEAYWAPSFVTIANRVQIGAVIGGGAAQVLGDVEDTLQFPPVVDPFTGQVFSPGFSDTVTVPANEVFIKVTPLIRAEAHVAVIVAPGLKVRLSGGLNGPGTGVRVGVVYLIGAD